MWFYEGNRSNDLKFDIICECLSYFSSTLRIKLRFYGVRSVICEIIRRNIIYLEKLVLYKNVEDPENANYCEGF